MIGKFIFIMFFVFGWAIIYFIKNAVAGAKLAHDMQNVTTAPNQAIIEHQSDLPLTLGQPLEIDQPPELGQPLELNQDLTVNEIVVRLVGCVAYQIEGGITKEKKTSEKPRDNWSLGYIYGFCESACSFRLWGGSKSINVLKGVYKALYGEPGSKLMERSAHLIYAENPAILQGYTESEADIRDWVNSDFAQPPHRLAKHLGFGYLYSYA